MARFSGRRSALTLALYGIVFTSVACDSMESDQVKADRAVRKAVATAMKVRQSPTTQTSAAALTDLTKAADEKNGSLTNRIRSRSLLAQTEFETGQRIGRETTALTPTVGRILWDIEQLGTQVRSLNESVKALSGMNPETTLKAIADERAKATAGGDAASKKAGELEAEIAKIKGQIDDLTKQKDAAITASDADADKASKLTGKAATELLDAVGENRRKAGNIGHDIDKLTAALLPLERDLAIEQGKKKAADAAAAVLDENKKSVEENWAEVQKQIEDQKAQLAKVGQAIDAKAKELDDVKKNAAELRAKAVEQFNKSSTHYAAVAGDAKTLGAELVTYGKEKFSAAPEKKAWEQLRSTYNLNIFKLLEAESDNAVGGLLTSQAEQLRAQLRVVNGISEALQAGGVTAPAQLGTAASLGDEVKKVADDAGAAYTKAAQTFLDVYNLPSNPKDLKDAARISRMFSLYGQYLDSDKKDGTKLEDAKKEFQEAFGDRKDDPIVRAMPEDLRA